MPILAATRLCPWSLPVVAGTSRSMPIRILQVPAVRIAANTGVLIPVVPDRADSGTGDYVPMTRATISKALIKRVFDLAHAEFLGAGWTKLESGIFSFDLSEDSYGCVGLNKVIGRNGILEINPIVGVGSHK
jgi:hypothetical protein